MKKLLIALFTVATTSIFAQSGCANPLSEEKFSAELVKVQAHDFDEAKKSAIEALFANCLTSTQIKDLLSELRFEEDKLELSKKAHANVSDPSNFGIIKEIFDFDDSKKAIDGLMK